MIAKSGGSTGCNDTASLPSAPPVRSGATTAVMSMSAPTPWLTLFRAWMGAKEAATARRMPLHFSAFHPSYRMRDVPPTSRATLRHARDIAKSAGLHHVYLGNVHDREGDTTFCATCGTPLIERNWYELVSWNLRNGACPRCGTACPGVFEARGGGWGAKRLAVKLGADEMVLS